MESTMKVVSIMIVNEVTMRSTVPLNASIG